MDEGIDGSFVERLPDFARDYYTQWAPVVFQTASTGAAQPGQNAQVTTSAPAATPATTSIAATAEANFKVLMDSVAGPARNAATESTVNAAAAPTPSKPAVAVAFAAPSINKEALEERKRKALERARAAKTVAGSVV